MSEVAFNIRTERTFSLMRKYAWLITVAVAVGGQFMPQLGLIVPVIMVSLGVMSLIKGRYWCGNFCPHGSLFDEIVLKISRFIMIPDFLKTRSVAALVFLFFIFNISRNFASILGAGGTVPFHHRLGFLFANTYLMVLVVGGLLGILINPRTWCQFCPMGTMQMGFHRLGKALNLTAGREEKVTVDHPERCLACGQCARVCPMELEPYRDFQEYDEHNQLESEKCIRCKTCVENCPAGVLQMATGDEAERIMDNADLDGFISAEYFQARLSRIKELKEDVREYTFDLIEPGEMDFQPGQFLLMEVEEERDLYRAYTISSADTDNSSVTVTIKKLDDGYGTNIIFSEFEEGDEVRLKGPLGDDIRIDTEEHENLLLIANGIGITPFVSTLERFFADGYEEKFAGEVELLYGVRYEEDLLYHDFFSQIEEENENLEYHHILSRPRSDDHPQGYVTHILEDLELDENTGIYMCGTPAMIDDAREILQEKGVSSSDINAESFDV